eukprot:COSAG02_NODE_65523_length_258_cov_0.509434_1_plen_42_part_01
MSEGEEWRARLGGRCREEERGGEGWAQQDACESTPQKLMPAK